MKIEILEERIGYGNGFPEKGDKIDVPDNVAAEFIAAGIAKAVKTKAEKE